MLSGTCTSESFAEDSPWASLAEILQCKLHWWLAKSSDMVNRMLHSKFGQIELPGPVKYIPMYDDDSSRENHTGNSINVGIFKPHLSYVSNSY